MSSNCYLREFDPPGFQLDQNSQIGWLDQYFKALIWDNSDLMSALEDAWKEPGIESELQLLRKLNQPTRNFYVLGKIIFDIENGGIVQALHNFMGVFPFFMSALHDIGATRSETVFGDLLRVLEQEGTDVRDPLDDWQEASKAAIEEFDRHYYSHRQDPSDTQECLDDELAHRLRLFIQNNLNNMQRIRKAHQR